MKWIHDDQAWLPTIRSFGKKGQRRIKIADAEIVANNQARKAIYNLVEIGKFGPFGNRDSTDEKNPGDDGQRAAVCVVLTLTSLRLLVVFFGNSLNTERKMFVILVECDNPYYVMMDGAGDYGCTLHKA
ncbi:15243_t:CDS:2 [Acaulospora morrowiae]|uniref:15243_t:CDS:1 n=1 Tax=Acaulospora morrowiae TaxID=94023 RepID=A0A9N9F535_9GLOM|nr:15243_t:CDS:2 [Acaulospora morrowiae]